MNTRLINEKGRVIGYKTSDGTYIKPGGQVVARIRHDRTYDAAGRLQGQGDQALRLFDKK